jgi:biopolymer transport protein ExbB
MSRSHVTVVRGRATHPADFAAASRLTAFNGKPQASATLPAKSQEAGACGLPLNDRAKCVVRPPKYRGGLALANDRWQGHNHQVAHVAERFTPRTFWMSASTRPLPARQFIRVGCVAFALAVLPLATSIGAAAQDAEGPDAGPRPTGPRAAPPSLWDLTVQGGVFMIPIAGCSVVVFAFIVERFIGLRRKKIVPPALLQELDRQTSQTTGLDPRVGYHACQQHPSPMANVLRAALLKTGRPHSEVEKAVEDAGAREVAALFTNVRPLNVCASIGPLLGLIGTVQGMIMAFIVTSTTTATGAAKAQELAQGIYTALVTTFAGLCVAIPAVLFAHFFEGKIDRLVREMEEIMLEILPHLERFEGKGRLKRVGRKLPATGETAPLAAAGDVAAATAQPPVAVPEDSGIVLTRTAVE